MLIEKIDHLVIPVSDMDAALDFYVGLLGMRADFSGGRVAVTFGSQKINLHRGKAELLPAARNPQFGAVDLCLLAKGPIERIQEELLEKGAKLETQIVGRTGATGPIDSIYLRDPDGNLIEISVLRQQ